MIIRQSKKAWNVTNSLIAETLHFTLRNKTNGLYLKKYCFLRIDFPS